MAQALFDKWSPQEKVTKASLAAAEAEEKARAKAASKRRKDAETDKELTAQLPLDEIEIAELTRSVAQPDFCNI